MRARPFVMLLIGVGAVATALSAACSSEDGAMLGLDPGPPEDLGVAVTPPGEVADHSALVWLGNDEILYEGANGIDLKAVRVSDSTIRVLNSSPRPMWRFVPSPDGQWIYRVRRGSSNVEYVLDRIPSTGGVAEVIAQNISAWPMAAFPPVSPNSNFVAYAALGEKQPRGTSYIGSTKDTLYVLDLRSGALTNLGFGVPWAFSPDNRQLLYEEKPCNETGLYSNPCDSYTVDLATDARTLVPWAKDDYGRVAWWDHTGIRGAAGCRMQVPDAANTWCVRNLSLGSVDIIHSEIIGVHVPWGGGGLEVSPNRRNVGGWTLHFKAGFVGLYVADIVAGGTALTVVSRSANTYRCAFSPDGRRVAYLYGTHDSQGNTVQIFVRDL